eukprot:CAMPEP_0115871198 /NCGR_PEP_ID=MMETSP0287-20121206/22738_1 /TAXON_ID=412157 /ORGANISM="Chrysochromulina rotalis, Strain UIO044" /LENGTH=982 /DNA_ID=CAMNT_0003325983 /DNA_START=223 /DNA_END=3171 /DNA_ORIENTATION=-
MNRYLKRKEARSKIHPLSRKRIYTCKESEEALHLLLGEKPLSPDHGPRLQSSREANGPRPSEIEASDAADAPTLPISARWYERCFARIRRCAWLTYLSFCTSPRSMTYREEADELAEGLGFCLGCQCLTLLTGMTVCITPCLCVPICLLNQRFSTLLKFCGTLGGTGGCWARCWRKCCIARQMSRGGLIANLDFVRIASRWQYCIFSYQAVCFGLTLGLQLWTYGTLLRSADMFGQLGLETSTVLVDSSSLGPMFFGVFSIVMLCLPPVCATWMTTRRLFRLYYSGKRVGFIFVRGHRGELVDLETAVHDAESQILHDDMASEVAPDAATPATDALSRLGKSTSRIMSRIFSSGRRTRRRSSDMASEGKSVKSVGLDSVRIVQMGPKQPSTPSVGTTGTRALACASGRTVSQGGARASASASASASRSTLSLPPLQERGTSAQEAELELTAAPVPADARASANASACASASASESASAAASASAPASEATSARVVTIAPVPAAPAVAFAPEAVLQPLDHDTPTHTVSTSTADGSSPQAESSSSLTARSSLGATLSVHSVHDRFSVPSSQMVMGQPITSALGVHRFLGLNDAQLYSGLADGIKAIEREFREHGTPDDLECFHYIMNQTSGSNRRVWPNGVLDNGRQDGLSFEYFCSHPAAQQAGLSPAHVLALRAYSTAAYRSLNAPLRDMRRETAHPFAVTIAYINEGLKRLRAVSAACDDANRYVDLWRGLRDMHVDDEFRVRGGTEMAPMSTTRSLAVAVRYSHSHHPLLLKVSTSSFMERGADIAFLSAFPGEEEVCFPPLTYLKPTGLKQSVHMQRVDEATGLPVEVTVIEVAPHFASWCPHMIRTEQSVMLFHGVGLEPVHERLRSHTGRHTHQQVKAASSMHVFEWFIVQVHVKSVAASVEQVCIEFAIIFPLAGGPPLLLRSSSSSTLHTLRQAVISQAHAAQATASSAPFSPDTARATPTPTGQRSGCVSCRVV